MREGRHEFHEWSLIEREGNGSQKETKESKGAFYHGLTPMGTEQAEPAPTMKRKEGETRISPMDTNWEEKGND
jgi:hypothetical protein